jgi:hypothetical protein
MSYERPWQPEPVPHWQTREQLYKILDTYRVWYDKGHSDTQISALIKQFFPTRSVSFRKGKR